MASIIWTDVTALDSNLSSIDSGVQTTVLAHVNEAFDVDVFGGESSSTLKLARQYLAAHMATLIRMAGQGASGPVSSESAGGLSRSYAVAQSGAGDLGATLWGSMLAHLIRTSPARSPLVVDA